MLNIVAKWLVVLHWENILLYVHKSRKETLTEPEILLCMVNLSSHGGKGKRDRGKAKQQKARREQEMVDCDTFARRKRKSQARWPMAAEQREDKNAGMALKGRTLWSLSLWIIPFHRLMFCRRHPQRETDKHTNKLLLWQKQCFSKL